MTVAPEFPVDLPDVPEERHHALGWTASIFAIASLSLALTNAVSIDSWGAELPPSPGVARVVAEADQWKAMTDRAGFGTARSSLHRLWKHMEAARWPGQQNAPDSAVA